MSWVSSARGRPDAREKQMSVKRDWLGTKSRQHQREKTGVSSWGYPEASLEWVSSLAVTGYDIVVLLYLLHITLSFLGTKNPFTTKDFLVIRLPAEVNFPLLGFMR